MPGNNQDPWGRKQDGPPDLVALLKRVFNSPKGGGFSGGSGPRQLKLLWIIPAIFVVIWFLFGFFIVNPQEEAVVTRFGKYIYTTGPGMHWIPSIVDSRTVINVQNTRILRYDASMLTIDTDINTKLSSKSLPGVTIAKSSTDSDDEGAKDISIVEAYITINYRIDNPRDFLFNTADPVETLAQATSSALRQEVGHMELEAVLSNQRELLRQKVAKQIRKIMSAYKTGIDVVDVTIQKTETPEEVRPAFLDVIKAQGEKNAYINLANAYAAKQYQLAVGESSRLLASATAYQNKVINKAKGDVARFDALLGAYTNAPTVTEDRLYYDTFEDVFSHTSNVVLDNNKGNNVIYLPLDQILKHQRMSNGSKTSTGDVSEKPYSTKPVEDDSSPNASAEESGTKSINYAQGFKGYGQGGQ